VNDEIVQPQPEAYRYIGRKKQELARIIEEDCDSKLSH
jgi:hypothetical protein